MHAAARPTSTITTSTRPIQNCQYCGVIDRKQFLQHPEHDGADQPAVEIAGTADHQHQHQVGGTLEGKHIERSQRRGLGEQRAGDPGIERCDRIDRDQAAVDRECRSRTPAAGCCLIARSDRPNGECTIRRASRNSSEQHGERIEQKPVLPNMSNANRPKIGCHLDALQAVGAAGEVGKPLGQRFQQQCDPERHHQTSEVRRPGLPGNW